MIDAGRTSDSNQRRTAVSFLILSALLASLASLMIVFTYAAACFDRDYNRGQWLDLGATGIMMTILPLNGVLCGILATCLLRRGVSKAIARGALVVAVLLGCPVTAIPLGRGLSGPAAALWRPYKDALDERNRLQGERAIAAEHATIVRHYGDLTAQFVEPQKIVDVDGGMIVLEDHKVLRLYDVTYSDRVVANLTDYVTTNLLGTHVVVRLPELERFKMRYHPGQSGYALRENDVFFGSPKDSDGVQYGTIPCLIYADERLVNDRFKIAP